MTCIVSQYKHERQKNCLCSKAHFRYRKNARCKAFGARPEQSGQRKQGDTQKGFCSMIYVHLTLCRKVGIIVKILKFRSEGEDGIQ